MLEIVVDGREGVSCYVWRWRCSSITFGMKTYEYKIHSKTNIVNYDHASHKVDES